MPGVSENIRVVSIVGRFLEHSRIFSFERPDETCIFIGSADLMPRNLYNRVELLTPVEDEDNRAQLADVLDRAFADNTNSWELGSDGVGRADHQRQSAAASSRAPRAPCRARQGGRSHRLEGSGPWASC